LAATSWASFRVLTGRDLFLYAALIVTKARRAWEAYTCIEMRSNPIKRKNRYGLMRTHRLIPCSVPVLGVGEPYPRHFFSTTYSVTGGRTFLRSFLSQDAPAATAEATFESKESFDGPLPALRLPFVFQSRV